MVGKSKLALMAISVGLLLVATPQAQTKTTGMTVDVPFDFMVANTAMNAGNYTVKLFAKGPCAMGCAVIQIEGQDGANAMSFIQPPNGKTTSGRASLVFHKYGEDKYFLAEIRLPGQAVQKAYMSESERAIALTYWQVKRIALYFGDGNYSGR